MSTPDIDDKKFFTFGLTMKCPKGESMIDCPLEKYRKMSIEDRLFFLEKLSEKEIDKIREHHRQCLLERIKQI